MICDHALYLFGRRAGETAWAQRLLAQPRAAALRRRIEARPALMAFLARFLYGLHGVATLTLGAHRLPWPVFALANLPAVLIWCHLWTLLGYVAGGAVERLIGHCRWTT